MPKSWTDDAQAPEVLKDHAHLKDSFFYTIKRRLLGNPLNRHSLNHQRLSKRYGLGILSSDCISSSAYGSEQILIALLPAFGLAAFAILMPMTAIVLVILLVITLSYRDVINVYTKVGGAYIVSRDNFGPVVAQIAAVALMLDYIVTIAIQSAAGVAAIDTVFPSIHDAAGLASYVDRAVRDGFTGMLAIHPSQVATINAGFTPSSAQLAYAQSIVDAFAANPGAGVLQLDGKMIDAPHFKAALSILSRA